MVSFPSDNECLKANTQFKGVCPATSPMVAGIISNVSAKEFIAICSIPSTFGASALR